MVNINPAIFREYDIRGIVGEDFTPEVIELLGKGYGTYLKEKGGKVASVGKDVRLSSEEFSKIFIRAINSTGVDVIDLGVVPTPLSYYSVNVLEIDGGVMITGSHNPPEYNGFKIGIGKTTIYGKEIQDFRRLIEKGEFARGKGDCKTYDIVSQYIEDVKGRVSLKRRLNVAVDAGNGCGGMFAPDIMKDIGASVECLYCEPDGRFPNHHPDPTVDAVSYTHLTLPTN